MKKLLFVFALLTGINGLVLAGGRQGNGWNVTVVTGTVATIASGSRVYLKRIVLSSGTTTSSGDYLQVFSTAPNAQNGGGLALMPNTLFNSTAAVTPAIVFNTTTTIAGSGTSLNNVWSAGDCDDCYIEIGSGLETFSAGQRATGALHIRKSAEGSGGANQAAVYWSN